MSRDDQAQAVFRCALLSPLLTGEIPEAEREAYFRKLAEREHLLPNGKRKHLSVRTFRRWWNRLKTEGVEGGYRRTRRDRGEPRKDKQRLLLDRAVELKKEQPRRSHVVINRILVKEFGRGVPRSTLYRHLKREGATRRKLGVGPTKIRCRWTRDHANELWVGDFEHGPPVLHEGRAVTTRLSAWIDCHSRYIVAARYYLREDLDVVVDSLLRAWGHHGASQGIYVDNAKVYHANALKLACAQLQVKLLHRPPRDPAPGGLIERFFQTLQGQLEAEIQAAKLMSLGEINRALQNWLHEEYHAAIHRETSETPRDRFQASIRFKRSVSMERVAKLFWQKEQRTVDRVFSDVTINGHFYAVDSKLRGDRLEVRYDPFPADGNLDEIEVYSLAGAFLGPGRRYQREKGYHPQPTETPLTAPIEPSYLDALEAAREAGHQQCRQQGLDFHSARERNTWSFTGFANCIAKLLGHDGGLASFQPRNWRR